MVAFLRFLRSSSLKEKSWQHSTLLLNLRVIRETVSVLDVDQCGFSLDENKTIQAKTTVIEIPNNTF